MSSLYGSEDQSQESSPEPQVPLNDQTDAPINADGPIIADDFSDEDSEFSSDSDITSLSSSVLDYEYENGRRLPNDEEEQDRMDLQSRWLLMLKGELHKAPVKNPQKILDLGTGTGIWALDIAEKFPTAKVIGNDISAIQPNWVTPNVEFIVEDFEQEWLYEKNSFDFIHARLLSGCVADWPQFFAQIFDHVKPGGYFEIQESAIWGWSDDGTLKPDAPILQYLHALNMAGIAMGREFNIYDKLEQWMIDAGFEDVEQFTFLLPYSPWPRDPHLKECGKYQGVMVQQAIESYGLRLCTQVLGWGAEPTRVFQAMAKKNLRDKNVHAYVKE
ncbi:hypothetical protein PEX1_004680 [Penicillium expansum]|uniref:Methyltransferase type 11 n=1 Tax=Penicillium expansum TaxID=27334 RepID=A0A0A2IY38_PENEN|nr:hypothetical protein PEX2_045040 [Penicillium expansum]KGO47378.1 hypothetical protein PEXP_081770 [Penicillium expansum]KGO61540.1 hypothetical protein PEX1_004680 [Penicillium expansum]KGO62981.1 hypothetical protein PEX2_045040 [Penicillium expansum]